MKKIPTIFVRDMDSKKKLVLPEINPGCEWVFAGDGMPTRKRDGTATMLVAPGNLLKRYDAKQGRQPPEGFEPAQDPDPKTGHWPGWLPVKEGAPEDKWFFSIPWPEVPGTYEFCGPKVNGNPEKLETHQFFPHGAEPVRELKTEVQSPPDIFKVLQFFFAQTVNGELEGIVWHHPDGRMAKIKRRDFGLRWPL